MIKTDEQHTLRVGCFSALGERLLYRFQPEVIRLKLAGIVQKWQRVSVTQVPCELPLPMEPPVTDAAVANAATHLEFLGYEIRPLSDGWVYAKHPYRWQFGLREYNWGINLHCSIRIGISLGSTRSWMEFMNTANKRATLARFFLEKTDTGDYRIILHAHVTGTYERCAFARAIDMWHDDLLLLKDRPAMSKEISESDHTDIAGALVH